MTSRRSPNLSLPSSGDSSANTGKTTWILHIDGDGFFAYCEIARYPHLWGQPVVAGEERGIACAMTYEAKRLGVTRGMPIFKIRDQFPDVVCLSSHFELYEHYATKLANLLRDRVDILERYSIDECFASIRLPTSWSKTQIIEWLRDLKTYIQKHIGLTYSFGLARTKVLAKVSSKLEKPDGCSCITPYEESDILKETPIKSIWGIGWRMSRRFEHMRVMTAWQFAQWDEAIVQKSFATPIQELWHELNGRTMFAVGSSDALPKSLQSTKSFVPGSSDVSFVIAELLQNIEVVFARMRKYGVATNAVSIFLKTTDRRYHSTAITLSHYTNNTLEVSDTIAEHAKALFQKGVRYKATGITVWGLRPMQHIPGDLFDIQETALAQGEIMHAVDTIRKRYGHSSIGILAAQPSIRDRMAKAKIRNAKETYITGLPFAYLGQVY